MSYEFDQNDGAVLYGEDGRVVWSSVRRQAYWTNYVSGSFEIEAIPGAKNGSSVGDVTTRNLRAVSPNATHIMGSFTATQSGGYTVAGVANGGIHQLGGTTFLMIALYPMYPSTWSDVVDVRYTTWVTGARDNVAAALILTTFVEGGWLKATVERYKPVDGSGSSNWSGLGQATVTIAYQGVAFTFDN